MENMKYFLNSNKYSLIFNICTARKCWQFVWNFIVAINAALLELKNYLLNCTQPCHFIMGVHQTFNNLLGECSLGKNFNGSHFNKYSILLIHKGIESSQ